MLTLPTPSKTILFDLDGTLVEAQERFFLAFNWTLQTFGQTALGWQQFLEDQRTDQLTRYLPEDDEAGRKFLWSLLRNFNRAGTEVIVRGIPGVGDALASLQSRGYRMGIVTGRRTRPESIRNELGKTGYLGYVEQIFAHVDGHGPEGSEVMEILSKKEIIRLAADRMGVPVRSCIFVGDWTGDIQSARQAGVGLIVAVLSGGLEEEVLKKEGPDLIVPSVADLPVYLP